MHQVAVVGGIRTPFMRSGTGAMLGSRELLVETLRALTEMYQLEDHCIGTVAVGSVLRHAADWNMAREAVLNSGLGAQTPAYGVQMACVSGLETVFQVADKIATGRIETGIACGTDSLSDPPIGLSSPFGRYLSEMFAKKSPVQSMRSLFNLHPRDFLPVAPAITEPSTGLSMGEHCELMAKEWNIAREDQDVWAAQSHANACQAYDAGFYDDLICPVGGVKRDNNLRCRPDAAKMARLAPSFDKDAGSITAGNASPLTDGAAAVLLARVDVAEKNGWPILALFKDYQTAAVAFSQGEEGLLMAPCYAIAQLLTRQGRRLDSFDYYEIHEAFAAQILATLKALEDTHYCKKRLKLDAALGVIDIEKINVVGGSVAIGHPFGATGGRMVGSVAKLLANATIPGASALISVCAAGGMGSAAIMESVSLRRGSL